MSESLRIAFYTDSFLPAVDGVVISILNFRKELERRGHEVYIYASGTDATKRLAAKDKRLIVVNGIKFSRYPQYSLALFPLESKLRTMHIKTDINHAHTPFMMGVHSLMVSKMDRVPIVGSFHTMFTDKSVIKDYTVNNSAVVKAISKYSWSYARFFYNKCDGVAAPSVALKRILERKQIRNVNVVPNGIDTKKFNPKVDGSKVRERLTHGKRSKVVMYVGRVSREKKLETMIKAARRMRKDDVVFAIVGSGPADAYYRNLVARMGLGNVKFMGFVDNAKLPEYYAACDAFCIPSTFETQGVVSLEAMAVGKPVIGADYLAIKDLINNGRNGERFSPGDDSECARKIRKVLYNLSSYKEPVETAKRYSIGVATNELLDLYGKVLDNKG